MNLEKIEKNEKFRLKCVEIMRHLKTTDTFFKLKNVAIQIHFMEFDQLNAWASEHEKYTDAGSICVFSSLMNLKESELYFIIAHELAHILHEDYNRYFITLPWVSRTAELRADSTAVRALKELYISFNAEHFFNYFIDSRTENSFFDTHPTAICRIKNIQKTS